MILASMLFCMGSLSNSIQKEQVPSNENGYSVEGQAGFIGAALSVGVSGKDQDTYLIKARYDANLQGAMGTAGLHYRKFYSGFHYFEPGIGVFNLGAEESLGDSKGGYAAMAFGWVISGENRQFQLGVEWTTVSILFHRDDKPSSVYATLPKFTLGTKF